MKFATKLYATNVRLSLLVERRLRRYYKFQDEIQFSFNTIREQLKHRDSESFRGCNRPISCFYQVLYHITCMTGLC